MGRSAGAVHRVHKRVKSTGTDSPTICSWIKVEFRFFMCYYRTNITYIKVVIIMSRNSNTTKEFKTFPVVIDLQLHKEARQAAILCDQTLQDYIVDAIKERNARILRTYQN